jgi:hypothetical protein
MKLSELIEILGRRLEDYGDGEVKFQNNGRDYYDEEKEVFVCIGAAKIPVNGVSVTAGREKERIHLITGSVEE